MTRQENELDKFGKLALDPLRRAPALDPEVCAMEKAKFLAHGENMRHSLIPGLNERRQNHHGRPRRLTPGILSFPLYRALAIGLVLLVLVAGSTFTVYAAQGSLPGEPLYSIKSASEDVRMAVTISPEAKLNLTLDYTNHRLSEIQTLVSSGQSLTAQTSDRYQNELEEALQLAAQLDDKHIEIALTQIRNQAEKQGLTLQELIDRLPNQASPAIIRLEERLEEQVQLSSIGEKNPQAFRDEIKLRARNRHGPKNSTDETGETPVLGTQMPYPPTGNGNNENFENQPTNEPNHGNSGNGQGQPSPGNGNHGPNPTHTPRPE